jgi:indolepyruvate ferredoxin oxidoreductase beta subunit
LSEGPRPLTLLIAALGGEGGGVLAGWVVSAAARSGWPTQSTSIPGVAQRTGATTYYLEMLPVEAAGGDARQPVMALTPFPGNVDVMLASELVEVGRAIQNGFVTPDRTTLVGSTHRIYAMQEKTGMADGRYDGKRVLEAAQRTARRSCLFDMEAAASESGGIISAVMLGALAGSGALPLPRATFEDIIREAGIAVDTNLRGFELGYRRAAKALEGPVRIAEAPVRRGRERASAAALLERVQASCPPAAQEVVREGVLRMLDYQGRHYAERYLERLEPVRTVDSAHGGDAQGWVLTGETARHLALRMSFEDIIRVADLKTQPARFARVRAEVRAAPGEPVVISEYLKPGIEEACAVLPGWLARPILGWAAARGFEDRLNIGMRVKSTSVTGFTTLWAIARLRWWRPWSWRFRDEQAHIDAWLSAVREAAAIDYGFGLEVAELARLIKGYGSTHRRGRGNFEAIMERVVRPALAARRPAGEWVRQAREAALADPEGKRLASVLQEPEPALAAAPAGPRETATTTSSAAAP